MEHLIESLKQLGGQRLAVLGAVGLFVMLAVGAAVYQLSRPPMQSIYMGLTQQDVSRITAALAEAGIPFDVNEQRSAVMVPHGQASGARSLLAQQGLPTSARAGYELFDNMGSLGLTSFMQEVTRIRALEGEIARTIQSLEGVGAARVHLVLAEAGSFRRERREASASVLLRLNGKWQAAAGRAVRHIVAAAVPGMRIENVSVASTDGRLIATGGDEQSAGSQRLTELERAMALELEQKAGRTLASSLGAGNFQVSITVRLDVDRQQVSETVYDPKSRVERSVKVVKQSGSTEEGQGNNAATVEANLPRPELAQADAEKRRQREDRREELINYEVNTKSTQTVREGYRVKRIAIAAVVNRRQLAAELGASADEAAIKARLDELRRLIAAATGADGAAEANIEISASEFGGEKGELPVTPAASLVEHLLLNMGPIVNALAMLAVVLVVILLGVRPMMRQLARRPEPSAGPTALEEAAAAPALQAATGRPAIASQGQSSRPEAAEKTPAEAETRSPEAHLRARLEAVVASNEEKAAKVLKTWMAEARQA